MNDKIRWVPVISSNIKMIAHNSKTKHMFVMFHNTNSIYEHKNVDQDLFERFLKANSKGRFYNKVFRGNKYYSIYVE